MNSLKEQLAATLTDVKRKRQSTFTDEERRVYILEHRFHFIENKIVLEGIYITPTRTGGFKQLVNTYVELGVATIVMSKVVNSKLAEYLFNDGWTLTSSKYGNWIDFTKNF